VERIREDVKDDESSNTKMIAGTETFKFLKMFFDSLTFTVTVMELSTA